MNTVTLIIALVFMVTLVCFAVALLAENPNKRAAFMVVGIVLMVANVFVFGTLRTKAQDEQAPYTSVWAECYTGVDENTMHMNIVYLSTGGDSEVYTAQVVSPEGADQLDTNIPSTFAAVAGTHDLGYIVMHSKDTPFTFSLYMVQVSTGLAMELPFNTWEVQDCTSPDYVPSPDLPTPVPVEIPPAVPTSAPVEVSQAVVQSTGRTCVVQYLPNNQVTLACHQ